MTVDVTGDVSWGNGRETWRSETIGSTVWCDSGVAERGDAFCIHQNLPDHQESQQDDLHDKSFLVCPPFPKRRRASKIGQSFGHRLPGRGKYLSYKASSPACIRSRGSKFGANDAFSAIRESDSPKDHAFARGCPRYLRQQSCTVGQVWSLYGELVDAGGLPRSLHLGRFQQCGIANEARQA